jgi:hypothetical protein
MDLLTSRFGRPLGLASDGFEVVIHSLQMLLKMDRVAWILVHRPVLDLESFLWGVAKKIRQESHKRANRIIAISDLPNQGNSLKGVDCIKNL